MDGKITPLVGVPSITNGPYLSNSHPTLFFPTLPFFLFFSILSSGRRGRTRADAGLRRRGALGLGGLRRWRDLRLGEIRRRRAIAGAERRRRGAMSGGRGARGPPSSTAAPWRADAGLRRPRDPPVGEIRRPRAPPWNGSTRPAATSARPGRELRRRELRPSRLRASSANAWRRGAKRRRQTSRARGTEPSWVRSVRHFSEDRANPHLGGIFSPGANPTLSSSIQTAARTGPLRLGSLRSPTKHTARAPPRPPGRSPRLP